MTVRLKIDFLLLEKHLMQDLLKYLSTAPVVLAVWMTITAGILIEFNRFFPDLLFHPM
jgi:photosystem I subunit 9